MASWRLSRCLKSSTLSCECFYLWDFMLRSNWQTGLPTGTKFFDVGRAVFEKYHSSCIKNMFIRESIDWS